MIRLIGERKDISLLFWFCAEAFRGGEPAPGTGRVYKDAGVSDTFAAKVFKISRDEQGNRLTHVKVTGGSLRVKTVIWDRRQKKSGPDQGLFRRKIHFAG